jgi:type VII secretion protein EccE
MIFTAAVAVHGKPHMPTQLHPDRATTHDTIPISVIIGQMNRYGLAVDVDIVSEGCRTSRDPYGRIYEHFLRGQPAAGQRKTVLLISLPVNPRQPDNIRGLSWRQNPGVAVAAAAKRIADELSQNDCQAQLLGPEQCRAAYTVHLGDPANTAASYRENWANCRRAGKIFLTSYTLNEITAATLNRVWAYPAEHTALQVRLRHNPDSSVRASATVTYTTVQPITVPPSLSLSTLAGRQWQALARPHTLGCPEVAVEGMELDAALVAGPSGVLLGKTGDALVLMPLTDPDPARQTRIHLHAGEREIRQLLRRAAGSGANINDIHSSLIINNGHGGDGIRIEHTGMKITVTTPRFAAEFTPVEYGNEEPWLR